jgi:hypothetical protein
MMTYFQKVHVNRVPKFLHGFQTVRHTDGSVEQVPLCPASCECKLDAKKND